MCYVGKLVYESWMLVLASKLTDITQLKYDWLFLARLGSLNLIKVAVKFRHT
jgi:hypothetical protein